VLPTPPTPLVRLGNLFPDRRVYAKCEHLAPSGSFKIRGAVHLLSHLAAAAQTRQLVVPSMGNTALGAAVAARAFGFSVTGVVPPSISAGKEEKLRALGVELIKVDSHSSELIDTARRLAGERGGYFVHPHLDPLWTDGYQLLVEEVLRELPGCRSLVVPVGGGGLLMGLSAYLLRHPAPVKLIGCEAHNFPTYAPYEHARSTTIADGLVLDVPHPPVQQRIREMGLPIRLVSDDAIRDALAALHHQQGLLVEPSSAITAAVVRAGDAAVEEPACIVLTGENVAREDLLRLVAPHS
jgi:threonine dehydratase